ncbi:MaoC/PaaZ C-terminal domain-containing protein [Ornithinimicrobium tianjinense]|uniref:MaoC-like domain-containing protein n=1 Tax=Ornithinimicrobium tianjinense TaxID=1195761 RepID=A0A917F7S6_9MICO|nr:MaoC/PaaZ C-terminal domain-containing protein [Ornithinimicrobium tianjinense]GGF55140.1 hypothetical protein GCM10011366_23790 [Ornithinimicrobium tianjinense]
MTAPDNSAPDNGSAPDGGQDLDVRLLESAPSVVSVLPQALRPRARAALPTLPRHRYVLADLEQDLARLADYREVTGGVLGDVVPASWLHVLTFPLHVRLMADREFPFPMLGMVHVANVMTQHRPVRAAERLTLTSWVDHLAPHRKGWTVDMVGEIRVGTEVVWEGRSTYLAKADRPATEATPATGATPATEHGRADGHAIPGPEVARWRLPADLGRRYAKVSGDVNPIHLSALSAKAFGFPRAIAHGMWTHARALAAVEPRLPGGYTVEAQWAKPILLPSTVELRGALGAGAGDLAVTSKGGAKLHLSLQVSGR